MEFLLKIFLRLLSFIPFTLQMFLGKLLGKLLYKALKKRRKVVAWNIHKCFPDMNKNEIEKLTKNNFTRIGQAIFEICNLTIGQTKNLKKRLKILMSLKKNRSN